MEPFVPLLFLLIFFLLLQLPALILRLVSRTADTPERQRQVRALMERRRQLVQDMFDQHDQRDQHEHPREVARPEAASPKAILRRPPSFEEVLPRKPISLESIESVEAVEERAPAASPPTRMPTPTRSKLVRRPIDVRRAIVLATLLGRPRGEDPIMVFPREP